MEVNTCFSVPREGLTPSRIALCPSVKSSGHMPYFIELDEELPCLFADQAGVVVLRLELASHAPCNRPQNAKLEAGLVALEVTISSRVLSLLPSAPPKSVRQPGQLSAKSKATAFIGLKGGCSSSTGWPGTSRRCQPWASATDALTAVACGPLISARGGRGMQYRISTAEIQKAREDIAKSAASSAVSARTSS